MAVAASTGRILDIRRKKAPCIFCFYFCIRRWLSRKFVHIVMTPARTKLMFVAAAFIAILLLSLVMSTSCPDDWRMGSSSGGLLDGNLEGATSMTLLDEPQPSPQQSQPPPQQSQPIGGPEGQPPIFGGPPPEGQPIIGVPPPGGQPIIGVPPPGGPGKLPPLRGRRHRQDYPQIKGGLPPLRGRRNRQDYPQIRGGLPPGI